MSASLTHPSCKRGGNSYVENVIRRGGAGLPSPVPKSATCLCPKQLPATPVPPAPKLHSSAPSAACQVAQNHAPSI